MLLISIPHLQAVSLGFVFTKFSLAFNFYYPWTVMFKKPQAQTEKKQLSLIFVFSVKSGSRFVIIRVCACTLSPLLDFASSRLVTISGLFFFFF